MQATQEDLVPNKEGTTTTRIHETEVERTQESQREQGQRQGSESTPREGAQQGDQQGQRPPAGSEPETV